MDTIKLLIWDLDETFWKGTLSDGEITPVPKNIELVKHLTDRGIVNSICSKNDYEKTKAKLEELGVWKYFVFPSIDWTPKGQRVKNIISDMNLRPVNCLFIDDNMNNLEEAKFAAGGGINVSLPEDLPELLKDPAFEGKDDSEHSRLKQYKILEEKAAARAQSGSNEEFLYQSEIHVELIEDCSDKLVRIYEMIHRNNQLNFTKDRISQEEVDRIFTDPEITSGVVHVTDKYGDHGIIGCYAIKDGKALQFVFSCRILGMGVEQWVYAELGYPDIEVVGEVATELNKTEKPEWINNSAHTEINVDMSNEKTPKLIVYGTCPLRPIWAYLQPKLPNAKFAEIDPAPAVLNLAVTKRETTEQKAKWLSEINDFSSEHTFDGDVFSEKTDYILVTLLYEKDKLKYVSKNTGSYFFSGRLTEANASKSVLEEYVPYEVTYDDIFNEMSYICEHLSPNTKLLIQTVTEAVLPVKGKDANYEMRLELNKLTEQLAGKYSCVHLIDIRPYANTAADFFDPVPEHFNRSIGFSLAQDIMSYMGIKTNTKNVLKSRDAQPENARTEQIKVKGYEDIFGNCTTWLINGHFHVVLDMKTISYNHRFRIWRSRNIILTTEISQESVLTVNIAKPGRWKVEIEFFNKETNKKIGGWASTPIDFNQYNYMDYYDSEYDYYEAAKGGINQFYNDNIWCANKINQVAKWVADLSAAGVNFADFFTLQGINEISVFGDERTLDIIMPFIHHSHVKIRYIFTPDAKKICGVCGDTIQYNIRDNNSFPLSDKDVVLYACYSVPDNTLLSELTAAKAKIYILNYVLHYMMTKVFFVDKYKNLPMFIVLRTVNLNNHSAFNLNIFSSNEKALLNMLKNDDEVIEQIKTNYSNLPSQYRSIPQSELLETMQKPNFRKRAGTFITEMQERNGEYLNIENGFRKTVGQPEKYLGKIYIFGGAHTFGCGVKDSETISSYLQQIIGLPYKVENYANCWSVKSYSEAFTLLDSMQFEKNDIAVFVMANWEKPATRNRHYHWLTWEAIEKPIITVDSLPLLERLERKDYFMHFNSYTSAYNLELAKLLRDAIYKNIKLFNNESLDKTDFEP